MFPLQLFMKPAEKHFEKAQGIDACRILEAL